MLRKIYTFIDDKIRENALVHFVSLGIFGIALFILFMVFITDFKPATDKDYEPLIKQQKEITTDFNTVYTYKNYSISPKGDNVNVALSNNECKINCTFDKELKFVNFTKVDLALHIVEAIFVSLFMGGFVCGGIISLALTMFIPWLISLVLKLLEKLCRILI